MLLTIWRGGGGGGGCKVKNSKKLSIWKNLTLFHTTIFPFPKVFSKDLYCRHVKTRACLGKG